MADVAFLVDTDVLVDCLRGSPQAAQWLSDHRDDTIGIPVIVLMELLQGPRSPAEQRVIRECLSRFWIEHVEGGDSQRALEWFSLYRLTHGSGIMDCLIATAATRLKVPLFTFNTRHFAPIPDIDARQPYVRPQAADQKNAPDGE